ncbi:MAG TPA: elongation factor G [Firmicutes bacterium]|uniref:elongation factor G n=1 Tax=Gelria sp. Kuro-4 TaxID=2796927 RepID=UPI0019C82CC0|nr:elongation factor G [Gelria sp. Kuro-4]BCV25074.1 elongation factor G [Gelria sp. Kuro-4]HHV56640.1 elongation factor G [Bacillota bacterium]
MKDYAPDKLRNVALISHGSAGKTSLTEALLFTSGGSDRLGRVDEGNTVADYDPDEIKRKITINTAVVPCEWTGCKVNLLDTPGYADFIGDVISALEVADAALVLVCAVSGVEVNTARMWHLAGEKGLPRIIFINKLDRENAHFDRVLDQVQAELSPRAIPLQLPIGAEANFRGIVDLVGMKALLFQNGKVEEAPLPEELKAAAEAQREKLVEAAAETDDELTLKYLDGEELTQEEILRGLRQGTLTGKLFPVLCGSAYQNKGMGLLLDAIVGYLPSPLDRPPAKATQAAGQSEVEIAPDPNGTLVAQAFKTMADPFVGKLTYFRVYRGKLVSDSIVYNTAKEKAERVGQVFIPRGKTQNPVSAVVAGDIGAVAKLQETATGDTLCDKDKAVLLPPLEFPRPSYSVAVAAKSKGDEDKLGLGLSRLMEEDPTLTLKKEAETRELILCGMGDVHIDVTVERLKRKFGVEVVTATPAIPYRETLRKPVKVEGKHKKQTGGHGQYGHVWLEMEPLPEGSGFVFEEKIFGGAVPKQYIPAVEKGVREAMREGILAGFPVVDVKVTLVDGSFHPVDSSEMAFKIAASLAFKKGAEQANPVILEPIMNLEVTVPENYMGDVIGDLNAKRGRILGLEPAGSLQVIKAQVPLSELSKYAIDLRSLTQGRGSFTIAFDHYEEVPARLAEEIAAQAKKTKAEE